MPPIHPRPPLSPWPTQMLAQAKRRRIHLLIVVPPVQIADSSTGHGFQEERTPEINAAVDDVVEGYAYSLSQEQVAHGQLKEDVLYDFERGEETLTGWSLRWCIGWLLLLWWAFGLVLGSG